MLERTGRRGVIRWKETRDRRRRCTLLGDYRRSIARWISNESLKFRWNITVQLYLNPLDSNSYFRSSPWTLGRAQVPRIFDTLVQKSNSNWIFASKREREKGRKARSACNLRLVGRDAGERVPLVSRSFLNSGREERGATRSRGRGRLLATTRPFARRLGPPLLASCRPTTASVCFRALVCASSGATVALLLYRPIRTFVLAPSLSLALEPTTWRPFGTASGGVRVMREQEFYYGRGPYRGIVRDSWGMRVQFFATVEKMKWMEDRLEFVRKVFFNGNGMFEIWRFRELNLIENVHISWKNSLGIFHFWISLIIVISIGTFTAKVFVWNENWLEILKFLLLTHAYNVRIFTVVSHVITFYTRMIRLLLLYHNFFIPV